MSIGVSGGTEFVSVINLRHRRFISTAVQAAASSQSPSGRPAGTNATLRGGRDLAVGLPGVMQRQEPYKSH